MKKLLALFRITLLTSVTMLFAVSCTTITKRNPSYSWNVIEVGAIMEPSEKVETIVAPYRSILDSMMNEVIGYAAQDLTNEGRYESVLGLFVCQLMLRQSQISYGHPVHAALVNHEGGLRAPINQGAISLKTVFRIMPFENDVLLLEMSGDSLTNLVEYIGRTGHCMLWPASYEVVDRGIENILLAGQPISKDRSYTIAISDYLANGGDGLHMLREAKRLEVAPKKLRDMIMDEIKKITSAGDSIKCDMVNMVTVIKP